MHLFDNFLPSSLENCIHCSLKFGSHWLEWSWMKKFGFGSHVLHTYFKQNPRTLISSLMTNVVTSLNSLVTIVVSVICPVTLMDIVKSPAMFLVSVNSPAALLVKVNSHVKLGIIRKLPVTLVASIGFPAAFDSSCKCLYHIGIWVTRALLHRCSVKCLQLLVCIGYILVLVGEGPLFIGVSGKRAPIQWWPVLTFLETGAPLGILIPAAILPCCPL